MVLKFEYHKKNVNSNPVLKYNVYTMFGIQRMPKDVLSRDLKSIISLETQ